MHVARLTPGSFKALVVIIIAFLPVFTIGIIGSSKAEKQKPTINPTMTWNMEGDDNPCEEIYDLIGIERTWDNNSTSSMLITGRVAVLPAKEDGQKFIVTDTTGSKIVVITKHEDGKTDCKGDHVVSCDIVGHAVPSMTTGWSDVTVELLDGATHTKLSLTTK